MGKTLHAFENDSRTLQGYLAHKKTPTPLGPPWDPRHGATIGFYEKAFSYERGTPVHAVEQDRSTLHAVVDDGRLEMVSIVTRDCTLQGYLAHKKAPPSLGTP